MTQNELMAWATMPANRNERQQLARKALELIARDSGWKVAHILRNEEGYTKVIYRVEPNKKKKENVQV